jgi:hypothetical protein
MMLVPVSVIGALHSDAVLAGPEPGFTQIARVQLDGSGATAGSGNEAMLDPGARRLLYWGPSGSTIYSVSLDTLKPVASVHEASTANGPNFPWALDGDRHRLFHMQSNGQLLVLPPTLEILDTRTLATVGTQLLLPTMGDTYGGYFWSQKDQLLYAVYTANEVNIGHSVAVAAIDPYASSGSPVLWVETIQGCDVPLRTNNASPLGESGDGKYLFTACATAGSGSGAVVRLSLPSAPRSAAGTWNGAVTLFPGLVTGHNSSALWIPNLDRMVITVASNGGAGWSAYVFDAKTSHFVSAPGLFVPPSDGHLTYSDAPTIGVDPASGRLLAQDRAIATLGRDSQGNVCQLVAPGSNTIVAQETSVIGASPLRFPTGDDGVNGLGHFAGYDPVGHNWWFLSQHQTPAPGGCGAPQPDASFLLAYHDSVPAAEEPPRASPDKATTDVAEQHGITGYNANADSSAYGMRYVLGPSGTDGFVAGSGQGTCDLNADLSHLQATSSLLPILGAPPAPAQYHAFCNSHGRVATLAHVGKVTLDNSEARATAITGDTDRETAADLEVGTDYSSPGRYADATSGYVNTAGSTQLPSPCPSASDSTTCDQYVGPVQPYLAGLALPYAPASCGDNGAGTQSATTTAPLQAHGQPDTSALTYPGSARVACSFDTQSAQGHADQSSAAVGGPIGAPAAAMTAIADASAIRTASDGSIATASSTVKDITVGSFLHIQSLTATASVRAHGRPGTNTPQYTCTIHGLMVSGVKLPNNVPSTIATASCQSAEVQTLMDALNNVFTGQVNLAFPPAPRPSDNPPGGELQVVQRQSAAGYLSEVALSELDQVQNSIITNDTSIEFPALVVTYYLDNAEARNHLVVSFAGVAATARYGIFKLDNSDGAGGMADGGSLPPATGTLPGDGSSQIAAGTSPAGAAASVAAAQAPRGRGIGAVAQAIVDGFRLLFQHPELIPPVLAVWLLFVGPGYLLSRRRALIVATEGGA